MLDMPTNDALAYVNRGAVLVGQGLFWTGARRDVDTIAAIGAQEETMRIGKTLTMMLTLLALTAPPVSRTQSGTDQEAKNAQEARQALDRMVQALGGQAWFDVKNQMREGYIAAFYHNQPNPGTTPFWEYHQWPDHDRIELTKHRDVVQFIIGREGWEVTFRGKKAMEKDSLDDFLRRRDHSIETIVKVWLKIPRRSCCTRGNACIRHMAEQVTLISPQNEAVTILIDTSSHLPLRRSFEWRDPVYKDKNLDAEEYDNYHTVDGLPTPSITRYKNNEMVRQYYVSNVVFNQELQADFWDVNGAAKRIKK